MANNAVLNLQYPTEEHRNAVKEYAATQFESLVKENPTSMIVVRENDDEKGKIIGFLKYEVHLEIEAEVPSDASGDAAASQNAPGGDWYEKYLRITKAVRTKNMRQPYIHLNLLCTDPDYQGRGVARSLIDQLKKIAVERRLPIYIESTMNAVSLYEKLGWKHIDNVSMMIPKEENGPPEVEYQERCMLWDGLA